MKNNFNNYTAVRDFQRKDQPTFPILKTTCVLKKGKKKKHILLFQ